jgi:hypothetical protein
VGWTAGIDASWGLHERVTINGGYMHEQYFKRMDSRSRPVVNNVGLDITSFDWASSITDTFDTVYLGIKFAIIPRVLDVAFNGSYAYALGRIDNRNPSGPPTGSTAANNATATVKPFPAFEDEFLRLEAVVAYHFLKNWTAKLGYVFESFNRHDWRTDQLNPFMPGVSAVFLGDDTKGYTAHILAGSIGFRF